MQVYTFIIIGNYVIGGDVSYNSAVTIWSTRYTGLMIATCWPKPVTFQKDTPVYRLPLFVL